MKLVPTLILILLCVLFSYSQAQYVRPNVIIQSNITPAVRQQIAQKYTSVFNLLQSPPGGALSTQQIADLAKLNTVKIYLGDPKVTGTTPDTGIFSQSVQAILSGTPSWLASVLMHEATHIKLYQEGGPCKSTGKKAEEESFKAQLELGKKLGLENHYYSIISGYLENGAIHHRTQTPGGYAMVHENWYFLPAAINLSRVSDTDVKAGDHVYICAERTMTMGPLAGDADGDGLLSKDISYQTSEYCFNPKILHGAVIYRILPKNAQWTDGQNWFLVGKARTHRGLVAPIDGFLEIGFNDRANMNNSGFFSITIMIVRKTI